MDLEGILAVDPENTYAKSTAAQINKIINPPKQSSKPAAKAKTKVKKKG